MVAGTADVITVHAFTCKQCLRARQSEASSSLLSFFCDFGEGFVPAVLVSDKLHLFQHNTSIETRFLRLSALRRIEAGVVQRGSVALHHILTSTYIHRYTLPATPRSTFTRLGSRRSIARVSRLPLRRRCVAFGRHRRSHLQQHGCQPQKPEYFRCPGVPSKSLSSYCNWARV